MGVSLKQLADSNRHELVQAWAETFGSSLPPNISQDIMRLIIGWEMQAKTSRSDVRRLRTALNKLLRCAVTTEDQTGTVINLKPSSHLAHACSEIGRDGHILLMYWIKDMPMMGSCLCFSPL